MSALCFYFKMPIQLVVVSAVRKAVRAATSIFTANSTILSFFIAYSEVTILGVIVATATVVVLS